MILANALPNFSSVPLNASKTNKCIVSTFAGNLVLLHTGNSYSATFHNDFSPECGVRPLSIIVTAIPHNARASGISLF